MKIRSIIQRPAGFHIRRIFLLLMALSWFCSTPARAADMLKVGIIEEPLTLNVWKASTRWSRKILENIHTPLFIRAPDGQNLTPWLAAAMPVYDPITLSYTVNLRQAKWSDGTDFTSADVAFTGNLIKRFKVPLYYPQWRFVKRIETPTKHKVTFFLQDPKAIFLTRTLTTPIVQKAAWEQIVLKIKKAKNPQKKLLDYPVENHVGTGPFVLTAWDRGKAITLSKNEFFFGKGKRIEGYRLGPYIPGIRFKPYQTTQEAIEALKNGKIDFFWWGVPPDARAALEKRDDVRIVKTHKSALYYLGFNMRKQPFFDINFRHAVAHLIDKQFIIQQVLNGNGDPLTSFVPPQNTKWHLPGIPGYGTGLTRNDRIKKAYSILSRTGYLWEIPPVTPDGKLRKGKNILRPDGQPMAPITILTPTRDYDPARARVGELVAGWLNDIGIPATAKPVEFRKLLERIKGRHDFDLFILGYGKLSLDPDYLRRFFHSRNNVKDGYNMSGYRNFHFDKMADESAGTMDLEKRKRLIGVLQRMLMHDIPYFPLYNPRLLEAVRKAKYDGWVETLGGIGNIWSFSTIQPK